VVTNPASVLSGTLFSKLFVVGRTFCGYRVVYARCTIESQLGVQERVLYDWQMASYPRLDLEESALQSLLEELKRSMLDHGATPEAVRWFGEVSPLSEEELKIMAEKLTKKAGTKAPAKKPAAKADKPAKAAKEPKAPDNRKIKVLKKDHGARDGSKTAARYDAIIASKTVQEALDNTAEPIKMADINYAVGKGIIALG
jgi:hypothetical protein